MAKQSFYAVHKGRTPGIYSSWEAAEKQVKGFPGAVQTKFTVRENAEVFVKTGINPLASDGSANLNTGGKTCRPPSTSYSTDKGKKRAAAVDDEVGNADSAWDVVYCDGACTNNQNADIAKAGIGVWWGPNDPRNVSKRCPGRQTNNRAELLAVLHILENTPLSKKPLKIKTDSQYTINCFNNWVEQWRKHGWTRSGKTLENKAIIRLIDAHLTRRGLFGQSIELEYVQAHVGIPGNEAADHLAVKGYNRPVIPKEPDWDALREALERQINGLKASPVDPLSVSPQAMYQGEPFAESSRLTDLWSPAKIRRVVTLPPMQHSPGLIVTPAAPTRGLKLVVNVEFAPEELADYADCLSDDSSDMEDVVLSQPKTFDSSHPHSTNPSSLPPSSDLPSASAPSLSQEEIEEYAQYVDEDWTADLSE